MSESRRICSVVFEMQGLDRSSYFGTPKEMEKVADREKGTACITSGDSHSIIGFKNSVFSVMCEGVPVSIVVLTVLMPERWDISRGVQKMGCHKKPPT
jgi:hypothetical protein